MNAFAQELHRLRQATGKSRTEIAIEAGCTATYIRWLEQGARTPPVTSKIQRILRAVAPNETTRLLTLLEEVRSEASTSRNKEIPIVFRKRENMSHKRFWLLCEELRNQREVLLSQRPSLTETCKILSQKLGFPVNRHALDNAREVTGVTWERTPSERKSPVGKDHVTRTLGNAIIVLYKQLGLDLPTDVMGLVERATGRIIQEAQASGHPLKITGE